MVENSRTKNTIMNTFAALLLKLVLAIVQFTMQTVFIHTLGKQYTGVSGLFSDILLVLSMTELGIGAAVLFALYKPIHDDDKETVAKYVRLIRKAYLVIAGVIFAIGLALLPFLKYIVKDVPDIEEDIRTIFMMFVAKTAGTYLFSYKTILLEAYQKKRKVSLITCVVSIVTVLIEIPLLILTHQYLLYLGVEIVSVLIKNVLISYCAKINCPEIMEKGKESLDSDLKHQLWNNIGALSVYRISNVVLNGTDSIIISGVIGTEIISLLVGYRMIVNLISDLMSQFFYSALPSVGDYIVSKTTEEAYGMYKKFQFMLFGITAVSATCLITLLNPFITIWLGKDFCFSMDIVVVIVLNFYTSMMAQVNTTFRNGYGLYMQGRFCPLIMAVMNIVLSLWWANYWSIFGVLLATSVSRLLTQAWVDPYLLFKHAFRCDGKHYWLTRIVYVVITVGTCLCSWMISDLLPMNVFMIAVRLVIALAIPVGVIVLVYCRTEEFGYLLATARRLLKKCINRGATNENRFYR